MTNDPQPGSTAPPSDDAEGAVAKRRIAPELMVVGACVLGMLVVGAILLIGRAGSDTSAAARPTTTPVPTTTRSSVSTRTATSTTLQRASEIEPTTTVPRTTIAPTTSSTAAPTTTSSPTTTLSPTTTSTAVATTLASPPAIPPAAFDRDVALEFFETYLRAAAERRYDEAWSMLSEPYQVKYLGYENFVDFWETVDGAGVYRSSVVVESSDRVTLRLELWFGRRVDGTRSDELVEVDISPTIDAGRVLITDYRYLGSL